MAAAAKNRAQEQATLTRNAGLSVDSFNIHALQATSGLWRSHTLATPTSFGQQYLPPPSTTRQPPPSAPPPSYQPDLRVCHLCGQTGHVQRICPTRGAVPGTSAAGQPPATTPLTRQASGSQPATSGGGSSGSVSSPGGWGITSANRTRGATCGYCQKMHHTTEQCKRKKNHLPPQNSQQVQKQQMQQPDYPVQESTTFQ